MKGKYLQIVKFYQAPVSKVFQAWADSEELKKWFPQDGMTMAVCEVDFRVGGKYRLMQSKDSPLMVGGEYQEIVPNKKIIFTWKFESEKMGNVSSVVTLDFQEKDGGTELSLTHEELGNDESVKNHTQGWNGCLERLGKCL